MCVPPICGVPGAIYSLGRIFQAGGPSRAASLKPTLIGLILTPLVISSFSVSKKVWNSKIQWLDQKLWLQEVSRCDFHNLLDISTVLTPMSTQE